ncbi:hypothetical protein Tco_0658536 [Tanacetum coccineum]
MRLNLKDLKFQKPRFASQVDVEKDLSKPVTQHYLLKGKEYVFSKPNHMIASSSSRNSSKNMPRFSSNDMVYNHYLDEARKKTQERDRNLKTSVMLSARFQSTTDDSKPKPRSTNHSTRSLHVPKSSCVTITTVPITYHSKNSNSFSDSKHFVCSTCHKWVPTGTILASCTSKDDSKPTHGSNVDIPNIHECKKTLDISAGRILIGIRRIFQMCGVKVPCFQLAHRFIKPQLILSTDKNKDIMKAQYWFKTFATLITVRLS